MAQERKRIVEINVPHLAESLVSATIGQWLKQPGDDVEQYEAICELITEKVTTEMPSPVEGKLVKILVGNGETAAVGTTICLIEQEDDAVESGTVVQESVESSQVTAKAPVGGNDQSMRARYSPAVLRMASEHKLNLEQIQGTGIGGRITRKDVEVAIAAQAERPASATMPVIQQTAAAPVSQNSSQSATSNMNHVNVPIRTTGLHLTEGPALTKMDEQSRGEYYIDVTPIRNTIASRTRQSVTEIPHAWTMIEVDVTNLVILRNKLKDEFRQREGINLTYLAFVLKAVVNAIKDYPIMNSVWGVDKISVKRDINISLAVGTEDFVVTPVIKKADEKTISGLAREIDTLTRKARTGQLSLNEMQGGTFTLNNTGSFGSVLSYPIINYPQAAILTFETIVQRPVVINDMIGVRSMANMCLSLDHRILDGVICGRFLQRVKKNLESYNLDTSLY